MVNLLNALKSVDASFLIIFMFSSIDFLNKIDGVMISSSEGFLLFGHNEIDNNRVRSVVQYSLDSYRIELTNFMETVQKLIFSTERADIVVPSLRDIHDGFRRKLLSVPKFWDINENALSSLLNTSKLDFILQLPLNESKWSLIDDVNTAQSPASYESLSQLLVHMTRDWTSCGESAREALYINGIIYALTRTSADLPGTRVLVPGAGLGRLAAELAVKGFK